MVKRFRHLDFGDKQNSQTVKKNQIQTFSALIHWTMKTPQNIVKMSTVNPDKQRYGDATDWLM